MSPSDARQPASVPRIRVIALGSRTHCDDEAALLAVAAIGVDAELVLAGRPGPDLVELLDPARPTILADAVLADAAPGSIVQLSLEALVDGSPFAGTVSSHGFGPAAALALGRALGRPLPPGRFVGLVGERFRPGAGMSPFVQRQLPAFTAAIEAAILALHP
jgi:hydrogenase maturation protease